MTPPGKLLALKNWALGARRSGRQFAFGARLPFFFRLKGLVRAFFYFLGQKDRTKKLGHFLVQKD
jgi:hypothetical protein